MEEPQDEASKALKAYSTFVRLVLPPYTVHFKSATSVKDAAMEMLDKRVCKESLRATSQRVEVRYVL